jgi:tetratricopeptide (TPR) repeat protein
MVSPYATVSLKELSVRRWMVLSFLLAFLFAALNGGAYLVAPVLFQADQARGPYTLANNYELTRVYSRSLEGYQQIVQQFPESAYYDAARIGSANSLMGLGRRDEAIVQYRQLLETLRTGDALKSNRLIVLSKLASALEEAGDMAQFQEVYALLAAEYPESPATADAKRYADTIAAANANASAPQSGGASDLVAIDISPAAVGKSFTMSVSVAPKAVPAGAFSIALNSSFVSAFDVVSVKPATSGTSDFWGKRFFQFSMAGDPLDVVFTLKPKAAGKQLLDIDLESNFTLIELNTTMSVDVAGQ